MATIAYYIVLIFGSLVCLASAVGLLFPQWLTDKVRAAWRLRPAMFFAEIVCRPCFALTTIPTTSKR